MSNIRLYHTKFFLYVFSLSFIFSEDVPIEYYGRNSFIIEGTAIADSLKENPYDRLPISYKSIVREPVWDLSKNSAGLSIRFKTNSSLIRVKWKVLNDESMNHMTETGIKGVDLYFNNAGFWQYIGSGRPYEEKKNDQLIIENMKPKMREYRLYLPLYDGTEELEVGIDSLSIMEKPIKYAEKPIVFYGTSITQGGCATRPGMAHTNIISRKLNIECINYGFSGNGRMEAEIAELIADIDAKFYVIECMANVSKDQIKENTIPLVNIIREKHSKTPILFIENIMFESGYLNQSVYNELSLEDEELRHQLNILIHNGVQNLFYIESEGAIGYDHEGTVDGVHFTDLGFLRYADFLIKQFENFGLITKE